MSLVPVADAEAQSSTRTCALTVVTVRGEPARFKTVARAKARANWRARVRATTGLGAVYSSWSRAANTKERCITGPAGSVCTFSGTPCR